MRALSLYSVGDLRLVDLAVPEPGPGEVRVRIAACGVCGSDIPRVFRKGTYHFPTVPGHEFAGTIDALGPDVPDWRTGDRVAVFPLIWCGRCEPCREGRYAQCEDYNYLGSRCDGAWAECVVAPARNLNRVPDGLPVELAAFCEPAAVARHAALRAGRGRDALVFGAGPIGLLVASWARSMGMAVRVQDIDPWKLDLARSLGFGNAGGEADVVFEGTGVPSVLLESIRRTRRGGSLVLLGNPEKEVVVPAELWSLAMRKEITLAGTWNSAYQPGSDDDDWAVSLAAMADGRLEVERLVSHRVGLDAASALLEAIRDRTEPTCKVLIQP